jgi:hypothetical protein
MFAVLLAMTDTQFGALMACIVGVVACVTGIIAIIFGRKAVIETPLVTASTEGVVATGASNSSKARTPRKRTQKMPGAGQKSHNDGVTNTDEQRSQEQPQNE